MKQARKEQRHRRTSRASDSDTDTARGNGKYTGYCGERDALFNRDSGAWLEHCCTDSTCEFCADRPDRHAPHGVRVNGKMTVCR